jgi:hypothetical protein
VRLRKVSSPNPVATEAHTTPNSTNVSTEEKATIRKLAAENITTLSTRILREREGGEMEGEHAWERVSRESWIVSHG